MIDETRFKYLEILIIELWGDIISNYRIIAQILYKIIVGGISDADNNTDSKNIYIKTSFSINNITSVGANNSSSTRNINDIGRMNNNADSKNSYVINQTSEKT